MIMFERRNTSEPTREKRTIPFFFLLLLFPPFNLFKRTYKDPYIAINGCK